MEPAQQESHPEEPQSVQENPSQEHEPQAVEKVEENHQQSSASVEEESKNEPNKAPSKEATPQNSNREEPKKSEENAENPEEEKKKKTLKDAANEVMKQLERENFANAYEGAVLDRKRESYQVFSDKEDKRRAETDSHKAIIATIISTVDSRVAWFDSGIKKTIKFFNDRATQEEEYVKIMTTGLPKLGTFFRDETKPELLMNFGKALEECDDFHIRQSKNSEVMSVFIRKHILETIVQVGEKEFKKAYETLKSPLSDFQKKLVALHAERAKRQKAYIYAYNEAQRSGKITKDRDMFHKEMESTINGHEELKLLKAYATQTLVLLNETVKLLVKRLTDIQKALTLYFQKYVDLYGYKASNPEVVMQLLQKFNGTEEIQQMFTVKNTLTLDEIKYFEQKTGKTEVTYQDVYNTLTANPPAINIVKSPLVLKSWKATRDAGILKTTRNCLVVVTVDGHVLVIEKNTENDDIIEGCYILGMKNLKIMNEEGKKDFSNVEIMEVVPGFLMDSKTKLTLKFGSEDSAEEFRHYVYNYFNSATLDKK